MSPPRAVFPAASTLLALGCFASSSRLSADNAPRLSEAPTAIYRYTPPAAPAAGPVVAPPVETPAPLAAPASGRPRKRVANPAARLAEETPATIYTPSAPATLDANGTLVLPKVTVPGAKEKLPPALPRLHVPRAVKNVGDGDEFETPAARSRRLVNKYYTPASQKMNKWLLNSVPAWAARDAAIADSSAQLNELAYLIELSLAAGTDTPEEQKKIRAEYYQVLKEKSR